MCKPLCQSLWQRANGLNLSLETLYNGQFTLSAQMIKPITGILYSPTNAVPGFILNFTPFIHSLHQFEINSVNHRLQTSWKKNCMEKPLLFTVSFYSHARWLYVIYQYRSTKNMLMGHSVVFQLQFSNPGKGFALFSSKF